MRGSYPDDLVIAGELYRPQDTATEDDSIIGQSFAVNQSFALMRHALSQVPLMNDVARKIGRFLDLAFYGGKTPLANGS